MTDQPDTTESADDRTGPEIAADLLAKVSYLHGYVTACFDQLDRRFDEHFAAGRAEAERIRNTMKENPVTDQTAVDIDDPEERAKVARMVFRKDPICDHDEDDQCFRAYCPVRMDRVADRLAKEKFLKGESSAISGWDIRNAVWTPPADRDERQQWLIREWDGLCPYENGITTAPSDTVKARAVTKEN